METCDRYYAEGRYKCDSKYYISCEECGEHSELIEKARKKRERECNKNKRKAKLYDEIINKQNNKNNL